MKATRIDSQRELIEFIHALKEHNIEIPENVTLEIDSKFLKEELELMVNSFWGFKIVSGLHRFKYMDQEVVFKHEELTLKP